MMNIEHQPSLHRFACMIDGQTSVLEYRMLGQTRIDFTHTFVPEVLRGRGIAERLVRTGLTWARGQGYSIEASCWYVRRFLRHGRS